MSSDEKIMPINAALILEVVGKPKEHLTETLNNLISQIEAEKDVKIVDKKVNEPVPLEKHEGFFTSFAEVEVRVEYLRNLMGLIFKYMPAHVDIIEPENVRMDNNTLSEILNELTRRLHGYDEIARVIQVEKKILENKLKAILGEKKTAHKEPKTEEKKSEEGKAEEKSEDKKVEEGKVEKEKSEEKKE